MVKKKHNLNICKSLENIKYKSGELADFKNIFSTLFVVAFCVASNRDPLFYTVHGRYFANMKLCVPRTVSDFLSVYRKNNLNRVCALIN